MGLFDNVFDSKSGTREMSKPEAFAGVLLAASAADGHIGEEEMRGLFTITQRMKLFEGMVEHKWQSMFDGLVKILKHDGVDGLIEKSAAALPEELRDCVFVNACDIILADGVVEEEEKDFLDRLQKKLEVDSDLALTAVELMILKNKG